MAAAATSSSSAFVLSKVRHNVSLSPCHITEPRVGIEQELTELLMRYSKSLRGVVLAFSNVRLAQPLGHIINEMPYIHCKVLADALVFQPREGMVLSGVINKIGSNHVGMLFAGVFNGSVAASALPKGFVHNYAQDAWVDAQGNSIAVDDVVDVKVLRVHVAGGMIAIEASMRGVKQRSGKTASSGAAVVSKSKTTVEKKGKGKGKVETVEKRKTKKSSKNGDATVAIKASKKRKNADALAAAPVVEEPKKSKKKSKKDE